MRLLVTDAAAQPPRQATAWLIMTLGSRKTLMESTLSKWWPVTCDFGLIRAPLEDVVECYVSWQASIGLSHSRADLSGSLDDVFEKIPPLSISMMRKLFVRTRSDWVAFFQNGINGSDPASSMPVLSERMGVESMRVCCHDENAVFPGVIWEVYSPTPLEGSGPGGHRRSIAAANDGGRWVFFQAGNPFPFEPTSRYLAKKKRERFTKGMLVEYASHFGVDLFRDDFFEINGECRAVRLERTTKVWSAGDFTIDELNNDRKKK